MRNECNFSVVTKVEMDKLITIINWWGAHHLLLHQVMSKGHPSGNCPPVNALMVKLTLIDRYGMQMVDKKESLLIWKL